jgi:hypothetical protein
VGRVFIRVKHVAAIPELVAAVPIPASAVMVEVPVFVNTFIDKSRTAYSN